MIFFLSKSIEWQIPTFRYTARKSKSSRKNKLDETILSLQTNSFLLLLMLFCRRVLKLNLSLLSNNRYQTILKSPKRYTRRQTLFSLIRLESHLAQMQQLLIWLALLSNKFCPKREPLLHRYLTLINLWRLYSSNKQYQLLKSMMWTTWTLRMTMETTTTMWITISSWTPTRWTAIH